MPEISVIIPVYNASQYLAACIESVIAQSFRDIEIICINDGSTDNSLQILQDFRKKDERIIIIDQKNTGVSAARNAGVVIAKAQYLAFVDSDDTLYCNYLEILYGLISSADLSVCGYVGSYEVGFKDCTINLMNVEFETFSSLLDTGLLFSCWCKLYKRDIINNNEIKFNNFINYGEDLLFNIEYLYKINKINITSDILYKYNVLNFDSLANNFNIKRFNDNNFQILEINTFLQKHFKLSIEIKRYITQKLYWNTYDACFYLYNNYHNIKHKERLLWIKEIFDFPYFKSSKRNRAKPHPLISLFSLQNTFIVYGYLYFRNIFSHKGK